jgi:hypothetical protein
MYIFAFASWKNICQTPSASVANPHLRSDGKLKFSSYIKSEEIGSGENQKEMERDRKSTRLNSSHAT